MREKSSDDIFLYYLISLKFYKTSPTRYHSNLLPCRCAKQYIGTPNLKRMKHLYIYVEEKYKEEFQP